MIEVRSKEFTEAVAWAARWAGSAGDRPIEAGLRLVARDDALGLEAGREDAWGRISLKISTTRGASEFDVAVSARLVAALAKTIKGRTPVVLDAVDERLELGHGDFRCTLPGMPVSDWPRREHLHAWQASVVGDALAAAAKRVGRACEGEASKVVALRCMRLELTEEGALLRAAALTEIGSQAIPLTVNPECWLATGATVLSPLLTDACTALTGQIRIASSPTLLTLSGHDRQVTMRQHDAGKQWPEGQVTKLLGLEHPHMVVLRVDELATAISRAALLREPKGPVRLHFTDGYVRTSGRGGDAAGTGDESLKAAGYTGDGMAFGFNPEYLVDALRSAPAEQVHVHFTNPQLPVALTTGDEDGWKHVVLPIRLRD